MRRQLKPYPSFLRDSSLANKTSLCQYGRRRHPKGSRR
jgi:hypothetical protein